MDFVLSELSEQVLAARGAERPVVIRGGNTKAFYGEHAGREEPGNAVVLHMAQYQGIVNYQPSELVVTARAGTLLADIEKTLDEHGQMLAFEPPRFGPASTIGGCVAAGLSGPRRMAAGSVRDFVLGAKLLDSSGQVLSFGGEVMKNVAGYDISRLLAGSLGIFGPLLEVSIKVAPKPFVEQTVVFHTDEAGAIERLNAWRSQPIPITATAWLKEHEAPCLYVRLSGSQSAVDAAYRKIGGDRVEAATAQAFWTSLRDHTHGFFKGDRLWRIAVPAQQAALAEGATLIEWNGGQRWLQGDCDAAALRRKVGGLGGHATAFRCAGQPSDLPYFHPLPEGLKNLSWRLKQELDPVGLFNPKRLFPDF